MRTWSEIMIVTTTTVQITERRFIFLHDVLFRGMCLILSKSTGRVASLDVMFIPQTSKSSVTMAEASSTAISSSPCHLGGITRLSFAPDGQYVLFYTFPNTPLLYIDLVIRDLERDVMRRVGRLTYRTMFTGGSDCLVRIHKANEPDSEPGFHDNHEDAVTSLTCEVS